ncbi:EF-hand domain-containing protein [Dinoroseobacter sp. S76]|uniref:EF-hand domain-containing protein n=1 Tax=Dinoroseobacter sp. S76 TaxID=3415124 RepID=UPI003C7E58AC
MKSMFLGLIASSALIATATAVSASTEMDTDGDGMYSFAELLVGFPTLTEETYTTMDANADGAVDAEELVAAQEGGLYPAGG